MTTHTKIMIVGIQLYNIFVKFSVLHLPVVTITSKTLKIKTGVVKRLTKEKLMYIQETDQQQEKVEKLRKAGIDESTLKKQEEVLRESQMMIPDTQRRLKAAFEDLKSVVADCEELKGEQDYLNAQKFLAEAEKEMN